MSRNKENNPLPSQKRANGSVFGVSKTTPSDEFFTDSILEDTSRIPSPSPHKQLSNKPRRAFQRTHPLKTSKNSLNTGHRSSSPKDGKERERKHTQPAPTLQRPKSVQTSASDLITPPQSRDGPPLASPMSDVSSPPRGLTETYQRIDEEEELAKQERESDEDSEETDLPENEDLPEKPVETVPLRQSQSGHTSVTTQREIDHQNEPVETTQALSEASGMSFLNQLTDQDLAAKMTPSIQQSARDKKRLDKFVTSKPILFNQGPKPSEQYLDEVRSTSSSGSGKSRIPQSFRMATKNGTNDDARSKSDASSQGRPQLKAFSRARGSPSKQETKDIKPESLVRTDEDLDEGDETSDELRGVERRFLLSQMKKQRDANREQRDDVEDAKENVTEAGDDVAVDDNSTQHSQQSNGSNHAQPLSKIPHRNTVPSTNKGVFNMWRRRTDERQADRTQSFSSQNSSQVDWANVGANVALPSVEEADSLTPQPTSPQRDAPDSLRSTKSHDRPRIWDNDFTSNSFQVSESPPVRNIKSKKSMEDYVREKEMAHLTKQAVTTNRLDAIREKDPRLANRRLSRSPSARALFDKIGDLQGEDTGDSFDVMGEPVPDTPAIIYRSSSSSSKNSSNVEKSGHDRQASHDRIQRLARALSTTPKSSPAPTMQKIEDDTPHQDFTKDSFASSADAPEVDEKPEKQHPSVTATPKVTGAWTDTILPDTVKTVKQFESKLPKYVQTPHVSAGGWVDTPVVSGTRQSSALAPMTIEEVTEELDTDVAQTTKAQTTSTDEPVSEQLSKSVAQLPRSAVQSILDQQQERNQRLISADITSAARPHTDDTLALGDATIASLQELIDDTQDEISAIIQKGAEHDARADSELLDTDMVQTLERMGSRLVGVQSALSVARKGISKLEQQVSHPTKMTGSEARQLLEQTLASAVYTQPPTSNTLVPLVYSTITLPLPLLFHPRKSAKSSISSSFGRPTFLGYLVLTVWVWYLIEVVLSELYSHPSHAEIYEWPPLDQPEPTFGFCLPTLLLRAIGVHARFDGLSSLLWIFTQPIFVLMRALFRVVGMWSGWTDGFVDDGRETIRNATKLIRTAAAAVTGSSVVADGLSMMDDEIL